MTSMFSVYLCIFSDTYKYVIFCLKNKVEIKIKCNKMSFLYIFKQHKQTSFYFYKNNLLKINIMLIYFIQHIFSNIFC